MGQKPNILLIHADQHRYDCLGAYGNTEIKTPHLDALAEQGVVYENSFCPYPICTPSRYSLLSGMYAHEHRGISNFSTLSSDIPTLPRCLRNAGYKTAAVGKMHFSPTYLDVGFDKMVLAEQAGKGRFDDDYHRWLRDEGVCDRLDHIDQVQEFRDQAPQDYWDQYGAMQSDLDEAHHSTTWIAERALEDINEWTEGGHFLKVGFIKPHHPCDPPAPWASMYDPNDIHVLPGWTDDFIHGDDGDAFFSFKDLDEQQMRRVMALYYGSISQIDHQVGRMVDVLKAKGIYDNTIIVYTSDHGDMMSYHHRFLKCYRMMEPLMRVPLIIKYPERYGVRDQRLINNIDLAPTLLSAVALAVPDTMSGQNMLDQNNDPAYVLGEYHDEYMIRSKTKKLLLHGREPNMYFDLEQDPLEMDNRYDDPACQADIEVLRQQIADWPSFDAPAENYLDQNAVQINKPNVPQEDTGLYAYFKDYIRERIGQPIHDSAD